MRRPDPRAKNSPPLKNSIVATVPRDGSGPPVPGKVSEMFHEFMEPLFDVDPAVSPPRTVAEVRSIVELATVCWNLPVFEATGDPACKAHDAEFQRALSKLPAVVRRALQDRIRARKTEFAGIPFYIDAWIRGDTLETARLVAEARMPKARTDAH